MNQKGFVTISAIFWTPVIVVLLFTTFWSLWFLQQKMRLDNLCHHFLLKSQESLVDSNNRIMDLNPKARALWLEKKTLDVVMLTAPPPVAAAAKVKRQAVVGQQLILNQTQRALFRSGEAQSKQVLIEMRREFHRLLREWATFWKSETPRLAHLKIHPSPSQLQTAIYDTARVYRRSFQHWRKQGISAHWQIPWQSLMPKWLLKFVPIQKKWLGECYSHPHSGGLKWRAAIGVGKH